MIASAIRPYEYNSTVAALYVQGLKCVIDNSIEFALEYRLQSKSTIIAVIGTRANDSNAM